MKNIFKVKPYKDMSFNLYRCKCNLQSCLSLCLIDLFTSIVFMISIKFNFIEANYDPILSLLITHLVIWCTFYLLSYVYGTEKSYKADCIYFFSYLIPSFFLHTALAMINSNSHSGLTIYPLYILSTCIFFSLTTFESILLYLTLGVIFIFHLTLNFPNGSMLNMMLLNVILTNFLAFTYSLIKQASSLKSYNIYIMLLTTIDNRDEVNEKLRLHEKYITDFFINISHDLKAPLNIIYSSEQLLEKQIYNKNIDYEKAEKYITSIKLNSIRLTRLLNNVLDVSKIDAAKFSLNLRNLDIVTTIENITDSLIDFMNSKGITLTFDTEFEEMILALDEEKVERIILNLLSNALKFTPPNGEISIHIYDDENFVFISIKDTGVGIDSDAQKYIFDRFVQGSSAPNSEMRGSGIGLSLVKSLMLLHGGDVLLESELGVGSNFILKFLKTNISETLSEDISNGSIYPNTISSSSTYLEFAGLVKNQCKNNNSS